MASFKSLRKKEPRLKQTSQEKNAPDILSISALAADGTRKGDIKK